MKTSKDCRTNRLIHLPSATPLIEPMYAKSVQSLPEGADWLYEVKLEVGIGMA